MCIKINKKDCTQKSMQFKLKQEQEITDIATVEIKEENVAFTDLNHHLTKFIDHTSKVIIFIKYIKQYHILLHSRFIFCVKM